MHKTRPRLCSSCVSTREYKCISTAGFTLHS